MKVTARFLTQHSILSLEVSQPISTTMNVRSGTWGLFGLVYPRDPLPAMECSNLFDTVIRWATSKGLSNKIAQSDWELWAERDASFRLYTGPLGGRQASPAKYRDLVKILQAYRAQVTRSGQVGWTGARINWGPVSRPAAGYFELAPGALISNLAVASSQNFTSF